MAEGGLILTQEQRTFAPGDIVHWSPESFRYDMREAERREVVHRMDVAGRARHLVWGPYDVLPAGRWQVTARLTFDRWSCRHKYYLEFGAVADFTRHEFSPGCEGVFEFVTEHSWDEDAKAELRIVMIESSLGGIFDFQGAELTYLG